ncbi:hypothetical protein [Bradyrhizobium diazoefficiens]|uniref:hypothetical protein n=1 Tax=Bradyrhizobium diazoefficiens TaxID=1355477 RepID=UPI00272BDF0E|nr:hypothetical protein [Bradyrhizobium diazoefficiens]WLA62370.1 hypothetical protein QNN01_28310 [Bradyrhizobium diazoefficiens]
MSAAIMLRQRNSIHLMVDSASYFSDGIIAGFLDKCRTMPEIRCAATTLGASLWQTIIFDAISDGFKSFDEVKAGIAPLLEQLYEAHADTVCEPGMWSSADVWVIGWSDEIDGPDGFVIGMDDLEDWTLQHGDDGRRPFVVEPLASLDLGLNMHPCPTAHQLFEARFPISLAESDRLIPDIDLLQLLEVQRRMLYRGRYHFIGGYALLTSVSRDGISQRRVHTWDEDEVGRLIVPQPIDWRRWRTEREAMCGIRPAGMRAHTQFH